jgi:crotonobetainyl-CoA:carnitine CoA-transferase CaiB-like acyl-CoA transferase
MSGGPLAGVRVVDLTSVVVGPTATLFLGDSGADVIKVESPQGDLLRTLGGSSKTGQLCGKFTHFNRNKRSLALDLKEPQARAVLDRLLGNADVFVANMRPAALKRLGLDAPALRARCPRLIVCTLAGFREDGPYRDRPAYDTIIQGMAGVAACNQRVSGEPRFVPLVFADHVVGLIAAQCILAALYQREKTGEGQSIEVPMFENMAQFVLSEHLGERTFVPPRGESGDRRVLNPLGRPLPTKDGWICVSANTDAQAFAFFNAIGRPELRHDPRLCSVKARYANVDAYFTVRAQALRERTTAEWLQIFQQADIPAGPVHDFDSLLDDAHLKAIGFFRTVEHPREGEMIELANPNKFSAGLRSPSRAAPLLGGDSAEILSELGYTDAEIDEMIAMKIVVDGRSPDRAKRYPGT